MLVFVCCPYVVLRKRGNGTVVRTSSLLPIRIRIQLRAGHLRGALLRSVCTQASSLVKCVCVRQSLLALFRARSMCAVAGAMVFTRSGQLMENLSLAFFQFVAAFMYVALGDAHGKVPHPRAHKYSSNTQKNTPTNGRTVTDRESSPSAMGFIVMCDLVYHRRLYIHIDLKAVHGFQRRLAATVASPRKRKRIV